MKMSQLIVWRVTIRGTRIIPRMIPVFEVTAGAIFDPVDGLNNLAKTLFHFTAGLSTIFTSVEVVAGAEISKHACY